MMEVERNVLLPALEGIRADLAELAVLLADLLTRASRSPKDRGTVALIEEGQEAVSLDLAVLDSLLGYIRRSSVPSSAESPPKGGH